MFVPLGLSVTGTADDMEALHAALRDAANTPTMRLDDSSYGLLTASVRETTAVFT